MRRYAAVALAAITALILAVTLQPVPTQAGLSVLWPFYGDRGTADALANIVLFVPLGAALAWFAPDSRRAWRFGFFLSLSVELAQRFIAGRDASIGDVITNTLGTLVGVALRRYVARGAYQPSRALWPFAALGFAAAVGVTVWMLLPAPTSITYYGMWTPSLGQFEWYQGRVLEATLNGSPLPPQPLTDPTPLRDFVRGRGALVTRFIAGPPTSAIAPLVSVFDERQREIVLLGPDRGDVVLRYRRHAADWNLDAPDLRFAHVAGAWAPGDTTVITIERTPGGACLTTAGTSVCLKDATPGRAWSLLLYPESFPAWSRTALDVLFVGGLALLLGWCAGTTRTAVAAGLLAIATLLALPPLIGGVAAPPGELAGAAGGLAAGLWGRLAARRASRPAP